LYSKDVSSKNYKDVKEVNFGFKFEFCARLVNDPANRSKFVNGAKNFLKTNKFEGMLLEWHFPVCWQSDCSKGSQPIP
jgi:GH18 family chitinase